MQKCDALAFGTEPRALIDEVNAGRFAALERAVEIVHGEADVMDARTTLGQELSDWGSGFIWLEEFDE